MWAFVIYDSKTRKIYVSRDRLGKKPLYYYENEDWLVFCSEPKQLLPLIDLQENKLESQAIMVTNTQATHIKETVFKDVYRFPNAHFSIFKLNSHNLIFKRYWSIKVNNNLNKVKYEKEQAEIYKEQFKDLVEDSVKLRMNSDVEIGAMLSGGLDSNVIVSIMSKFQSKLKVFSNVLDEFEPELQEKNELSKIRLSEKRYDLSVDYIQDKYNFEDFITSFSSMLWYYDSPSPWFGHGAVSLTKKAQEKKVKVILGGQGADEILAGYDDFWIWSSEKIIRNFLRKKVKIPKNVVLKSLLFNNKIFSLMHPFLFKLKYKKNAKLLGVKWTKELSDYLTYRNYVNPRMTLSEALKVSVERNLSYLLYGEDRHSMQSSVESRLPFTDYRLVEFVFALPDAYKMHDGWTKYILRLAFNKELPDEIVWNKKKIGFEGADKFYFDNDANLRTSLINYLSEIDNETNYQNLYNENYSLFIAKMANIIFLNKYKSKDLI